MMFETHSASCFCGYLVYILTFFSEVVYIMLKRENAERMTSFSGDSSWVSAEKSRYWYHHLFGRILRQGIVPKHVAFIMDGNRTFAKKHSLQTLTIHEKGFGKLTEVLQWCTDMGIYEVTFWAFSVENFRRTKKEVDALMDIARERFQKLIEDWRNLQESGICVRVIGNLNLLPKDLTRLIMMAMLLTKDNKRACLNIALSYTSRDEITNTSRLIVHGIRNNKLKNEIVTADLLDRCLYTYQSEPVDMIVRTSGQYRLSDFLMWQGAHSYLHVVEALWPELSVWNFMCAIFRYQHFVSRSKKPSKKGYKLERRDFYKVVNHVQMERYRERINISKLEGISSDWEMLTTLTSRELYDYYLQKA